MSGVIFAGTGVATIFGSGNPEPFFVHDLIEVQANEIACDPSAAVRVTNELTAAMPVSTDLGHSCGLCHNRRRKAFLP